MQNTSITPTSPTVGSTVASYRVRPQFASLTLGAAAGVGLLVWTVATPVGGLELQVAGAGTTVGPTSIIVAALLGGAMAWLLLAAIGRRPRGRTWWTRTAVIVLLLSLAGPALSGATGGALIILELMHLLVGTVLILGLRRSAVPQAVAGRTVTAEAS